MPFFFLRAYAMRITRHKVCIICERKLFFGMSLAYQGCIYLIKT